MSNTTKYPVMGGAMLPGGQVHLEVLRHRTTPKRPAKPLSIQRMLHDGFPAYTDSPVVKAWRRANLQTLLRGIWPWLWMREISKHTGQVWLEPKLYLTVQHADGPFVDLGLTSLRLITDTGVGYLVDAWQNIVELENMKFHAIGTGVGAEAAGNTALGTEWTSSEYAARATGSLTEGASANIFRSLGTNTKLNAGTSAVTEHGLLSSATIGAGVLWDRSVFAAYNLTQGDSLSSQYDMTATSGG